MALIKKTRQRERIIWLLSDDYPNVPFQLTGTAYGLSIIPPMKITLLVSRDPQELLSIRYNNTATVTSPVLVYGAKIDDVLVADPVIGYNLAIKHKSNKLVMAWIAAFMALVCSCMTGWLIWKRFSKY